MDALQRSCVERASAASATVAEPNQPALSELDVRYARAELAALYARLRPQSGQPLSISDSFELAWVARGWAQRTVASYRAGEVLADEARGAALVLRAIRAGIAGQLAEQVLSGAASADWLVLWMTLFSAKRTRGLIGQLKLLVQLECRAELERLRRIDLRIERAERDERRLRREAVAHDEQAVEALRNRQLDADKRASQSSHHRTTAQELRGRAESCRKLVRRLHDERHELWEARPHSVDLHRTLHQQLAAGEQGALPEPMQDLRTALHCLPHVCETITEHALVWLWRGTPPRRWLFRHGYRAVPAARPVESVKWFRVVATRRFDPELPKGTVLRGLRDEDLTADEMRALRASRTAKRKQLERDLEGWLVPVLWLALNDPDEREELHARAAMWRQNGIEGRRKRREYLLKAGDRFHRQKRMYRADLRDLQDPFAVDLDETVQGFEVRPLPKRPSSPELVAFRWPEGGPMRYGEVGKNLVSIKAPAEGLRLEEKEA